MKIGISYAGGSLDPYGMGIKIRNFLASKTDKGYLCQGSLEEQKAKNKYILKGEL